MKKAKRTQVKDLAITEQELSGKEMEQVQGGGTNLHSSKSDTPLTPSASTAGQSSEKKGPNAVNVKLA